MENSTNPDSSSNINLYAFPSQNVYDQIMSGQTQFRLTLDGRVEIVKVEGNIQNPQLDNSETKNVISKIKNESNYPDDAVYVNPKQYYRILKRREARAKLQTRFLFERRKFMYQSRHKHALKRPRDPSGRFISTKDTTIKEE